MRTLIFAGWPNVSGENLATGRALFRRHRQHGAVRRVAVSIGDASGRRTREAEWGIIMMAAVPDTAN